MVLLASACAVPEDAPTPRSSTETSDVPLHVTRADAKHPAAGAAGNVVECDTWGDGGSSTADVYGDGATADSPEEALEVARSEGGLFPGVTPEDVDVAERTDDRVLYVLEVHGAIKQAVIVRDGPATEGAGGPGWYVESWARCDLAELPRSLTESFGLQVWTDASGDPVPTTKLESWTGSSHCGWESMTFLTLDHEATFVRNPQADLGEFFTEPYLEHATLPADAQDTGFLRDGDHLWVSSDGQRVYVGTADDVEVWPRTIRGLACD